MIEEKKEEINEANVNPTEKPVENINIVCSKHGLINNGAFYLKYNTIQKGEGKNISVDNNNIFCIACLNDLYMKFQKSGDIGTIQLNVKYADTDKREDVPVSDVEKPTEDSKE